MKKIKLNKYLHLVFISVFLIALFTPVNAFASQTDDSMEVIARIEAPTEESPSSTIIDSDSKAQQTDSDSSLALWILLPSISCSALAVTVVYVKRKKHTAK